jgi:SAM-dependent methyltransferase
VCYGRKYKTGDHAIKRWLFRLWYKYVNYLDRDAEVLFMNYGYSHPDREFRLDPEYEPNRFSIQLYHLLASDVELANKDILEVGSGRGGGLAYLARTFSPRRALGVDLAGPASRFCNQVFRHHGLSFAQGDAHNLSFLEDGSFDAVFNVESSHRYSNLSLFLKEVYRLLRPGGHFLFTDFRYVYKLEELKKQLDSSGLLFLKEETITEYVIRALTADDERKRQLIRKLAPVWIRRLALRFAATIGTGTYNKFTSGRFGYYLFLMQKPLPA